MTILEYIDHYKDKTFKELAFNEVDNVIFSSISYIDLDDVVSTWSKEKISIAEAKRKYFENYQKNGKKMIAYKHAIDIFEHIANTNRYKDLLLYNYAYIGDENRQFSAVTIEINENLIYISYEGTDHLVSGWMEDFKMSYLFPVPAQKHAIRYLDKYIFSKKDIILGGHSKGGNLALVAGMYANIFVRSKIIKIYVNDGPGLKKAQFESQKYQNIKDKLVNIIPNYALVGLLLQHSNDYKVVLSSKKGVLAHDLFTWRVDDVTFIETELSTFSKILNKSMNSWANKYNDYQRKEFTESLFSVFKRAGRKSLEEVLQNKTLILKLVYESREINKETKKMLREFIWILFEYIKDYKEL